MPELPEVETVVRSVRPHLVGRRITATRRSDKKLRRPLTPADLKKLVGAKVTGVERRGKYFIIETSSPYVVLGHLGMTGRLLVQSSKHEAVPHTHAMLALDDKRELRFVDPRRFGQFSVVKREALAKRDELRVLGPDPFSAEFTVEFLVAALAKRKAPMKAVVLDQKVFCGMGNIYVAEALHLARISPRRIASRVKASEIAALHRASIFVLEQSINNRGTSFSDYVDADGEFGANEDHLQVYGREGEPCYQCHTEIRRLVQSGRSTFYCPGCQK